MANLVGPLEILFDEEPHTYTVGGKIIESVTQMIERSGFGDDFSRVHPVIMERAKWRGTQVHKYCQEINEGKKPDVSPVLVGYVDGYRKFRKEKKLTIVAAERRIASTALGVAGTPDLVCFMDGVRTVIDYKTNVSRSTGLQTAGYKIIWNNNEPKKPIERRYGLRLGGEGSYKLIPLTDPDDEPAFWDMIGYFRLESAMERWRLKYRT